VEDNDAAAGVYYDFRHVAFGTRARNIRPDEITSFAEKPAYISGCPLFYVRVPSSAAEWKTFG